MRRLGAVVASAAAVLGVAVIGAPGAAGKALAIGQCTTSSNVVLAVDFGHWGGPVVRSCGSTPTTGYALLNQGGFRTEGTKHDGPAFICRIASSSFHGGDTYPRPKDDACVVTPPASAYWSYWHADAGQNTWSYSQLGAMSYRSEPGSVEYWQFGGTNVEGTQGRPSVSPDAVRATNAAPRGSTGGGSRGGGSDAGGPNAGGSTRGSHSSGSHGSGSHGSGADGGGATAPGPDRTAAPERPRGTGSSTAPSRPGATAPGRASSSASRPAGATTSASSAGSSGPQIIDAKPASATPSATSDSGSLLPIVLVAGLVVVLGGGAGFTVLRRRRADADL